MVDVAKPEGKKITVIDYDITLSSGRELPPFTVRPDLGDEEITTDTHILFTLAATSHQVMLTRAHIAVISRRERVVTLLPEKFEPKAPKVDGPSNLLEFARDKP